MNIKQATTASIALLLSSTAMAHHAVLEFDLHNSAGNGLYEEDSQCYISVADKKSVFNISQDSDGIGTVQSSDDAGGQDKANVAIDCPNLQSIDPDLEQTGTAGFDLGVLFNYPDQGGTYEKTTQFVSNGSYSAYNPNCIPQLIDANGNPEDNNNPSPYQVENGNPTYKMTCKYT